MEIHLDIKPEDINREVTQAIVNSAFGSTLKDSINETIKRFSGTNYWSSTMETHVTNELHKIVSNMVRDQYSDKIREQVAKHLTPDFINEIVSKSVAKVIKSMKDGY